MMCILPTPRLGWIGQIKGRSLSLASRQLFSGASVERSSLRNAHSSTHSVSSRQCHMATFYNTQTKDLEHTTDNYY
jgi:hypothetical protein